MTIEEMIKRKRESGYTNEQVAKGSGVPLGTIQKIFSGRTEHPRYDTIEMLSRFFDIMFDTSIFTTMEPMPTIVRGIL